MKKGKSRNPINQLASLVGAKQSELIELLGVSRSMYYMVSRGERPLTGRVLEKMELFRIDVHSSNQKRSEPNGIGRTECSRKASIADKKINDVRDELQFLRETEDAIYNVSLLLEKFSVRSKEHDWCKLHLRRLKHRLPKNPAMQRAEWEAKLTGLEAEKKYWEKKSQ
jgi:hypothetical protein